MASPVLTDKEIETACAKAEIAIEKILIDLENDTGRTIYNVNIDTRIFANCNTEIFFKTYTDTLLSSHGNTWVRDPMDLVSPHNPLGKNGPRCIVSNDGVRWKPANEITLKPI